MISSGSATWRTREVGGIRVRMVEYSPGYRADHWCRKGHVLLVLEGELETELDDGRRLRVWQAAALASAPRPARAGSIVAASKAGIDVAAGAGILRLQRVQPPSGRVMDVEAYLAAHSLDGATFVG